MKILIVSGYTALLPVSLFVRRYSLAIQRRRQTIRAALPKNI